MFPVKKTKGNICIERLVKTLELTFGSFLTQKRKDRGITLREFARRVGISAEYVCNVEKCRKPAPSAEILEKIAQVLNFSKDEREQMYDLAASSRNTENVLPEDLTGFLNDNRIVLTALRIAKDVDATDEEWQEFIKMLKDKRKH